MALVTKTLKDLPQLDEAEIQKRWEQAPESMPDEPIPSNPSLWPRISLEELVEEIGKQRITIGLDKKVVKFFKNRAKKRNSKYQTDINTVLVSFMEAQKNGQIEKEHDYS